MRGKKLVKLDISKIYLSAQSNNAVEQNVNSEMKWEISMSESVERTSAVCSNVERVEDITII